VGLSTTEIAGKLKRHDASIRKVIRGNKGQPAHTVPWAPERQAGHPRIISADLKRGFRQHFLKYPFTTAKELQA
jgi:hypothetical protein